MAGPARPRCWRQCWLRPGCSRLGWSRPGWELRLRRDARRSRMMLPRATRRSRPAAALLARRVPGADRCHLVDLVGERDRARGRAGRGDEVVIDRPVGARFTGIDAVLTGLMALERDVGADVTVGIMLDAVHGDLAVLARSQITGPGPVRVVGHL